VIHDINSEEDLNELARKWETEIGPGKITRIEDLPDLDQVNGSNVVWVVEGIIAEGALHMITSEPGAGKSTFVAALCDAVSRGMPFMGRPTSKRKILILDAENPLPAIRERFDRLSIRTREDFKIWGQWVGEDAPQAGGVIVQEWVSRCNPKPMIVIDSVIAFHPGAENASDESGSIWRSTVNSPPWV
jgi:RecA-family ATPase